MTPAPWLLTPLNTSPCPEPQLKGSSDSLSPPGSKSRHRSRLLPSPRFRSDFSPFQSSRARATWRWSRSHLRGSSPPNSSFLRACRGAWARWSAPRHTAPSAGPRGRGPSTRSGFHTPSGCPTESTGRAAVMGTVWVTAKPHLWEFVLRPSEVQGVTCTCWRWRNQSPKCFVGSAVTVMEALAFFFLNIFFRKTPYCCTCSRLHHW